MRKLFVICRYSLSFRLLPVDSTEVSDRHALPQFSLATPVLYGRHGLRCWAAPPPLFVANIARIAGTIEISALRVCLQCKGTAFRKEANRAQLGVFLVTNCRQDCSGVG